MSPTNPRPTTRAVQHQPQAAAGQPQPHVAAAQSPSPHTAGGRPNAPAGQSQPSALASQLPGPHPASAAASRPHPQPPALQRPLTRRSFLAAAAALTAAAWCGAAGCASPTANGGAETKAAYVSPYNWEGLVRSDGRWDYFEDGQLASRWGIDVSEHQKAIDWGQVAAAGVEFAFVRIGNRGATKGLLRVDDCFLANATGAKGAGIQTESYFFSQAITEEEAEEEAAFAIQQVQEANGQGAAISLIAYDHEPVETEGARANALSGEQLSLNTAAFCGVVAQAGFQPLVYGNRRSLFRLSEEVRSACPVWLAEYNTPSPTAPLDFVLWQYSNAGSVPGISINVDLNIWFNQPST
nr:GH25 family lysozyme [Parvibacter caecicola]